MQEDTIIQKNLFAIDNDNDKQKNTIIGFGDWSKKNSIIKKICK